MTDVIEPISRLLRQQIGLRDDRASKARLRHAAQALAEQAQIELSALPARLTADPDLRRRLVDHVTVQESQFFRDAPLFAVLRSQILPQCGDPVTVWSAGCALGQEAWSVAMLLSEAGRHDWRVLATDVSADAVARGRAGHFAQRELRGLSAARRDRFMTVDDSGFTVAPALRERVSFTEHNLVRDPLPAQVASAGLVLLRNVLIYFDQAEIQRLFARLAQTLPPGAWVVLGGSEILHAVPGFALTRVDELFVYRATGAPVATTPPAPPPPPVQAPRPAQLPSRESLLAAGERHAAAGRPAAAVTCFRRLVYLDPDDPAARLLLALAFDAAGDCDAARRAYRATAATFARRSPGDLPPRVAGYGIDEVRGLLAERLDDPELVT